MGMKASTKVAEEALKITDTFMEAESVCTREEAQEVHLNGMRNRGGNTRCP